ncbi:hypothetical protein [Acidithiobacillus sp.]|uniref:hypothetical protein n=1 Tax=Acidithiobacillus sp. TaxID=1872118 RepID=UPI0023261A9D|nr:hypothetical protein [Acidithiobacillus sp.]MDA8247182.1 hypothetical protein [Acidithiobacillus sp.]
MTTLPCPGPQAPFAEVVEAVALWYRHFLTMQPDDYHGRRWAERMVESSLVMLCRRWDRREILAEGIRQGCTRQGCSRQGYSRQSALPANNQQTAPQGARIPVKNTTGNRMLQQFGEQNRQMDLF